VISLSPLLAELFDVCGPLAAEMESAGFHVGDWRVTRIRVGDFGVVRRDGRASIYHTGSRWYITDHLRMPSGDGQTLVEAVAKARANGWPL